MGVAAILNAPLAPALVTAIVLVAGVLCFAFTLGYRYRFTGPLFALAFLWLTSYRNSWGHVSHGDNLAVLHVLILAFAPAADALSLDASRHSVSSGWSPRYGWPLRLIAVTTAVTYVLAGWAKLHFGGVAWLGGDVVRLQVAFDGLRKSRFGLTPSPLASALLPHPWAFAPVAVATLAIELGAPIALLGRRLAALWTLAIWSLHLGIAVLMTLVFAYPLSLVAFVALFRSERVLAWFRQYWRRRRSTSAP
ncbi:MAG: HTTM domain-containing protein [Nannocystaceae bacterium]|nr:HTTM domain-containing protein [Nannocystaceae bacterium]